MTTRLHGCVTTSNPTISSIGLLGVILIVVLQSSGSNAAVAGSLGNVTVETVVEDAGRNRTFSCGDVQSNCRYLWDFKRTMDIEDQDIVMGAISANLSLTPNYVNIRTDNDKLTITSVAAGNTGTYTCFKLCDGVQSTKKWELKVTGAKLQLVRSKYNRPLAGGSFLLECLNGNGGAVNVTWTKDGLPIEQLPQFSQRVLMQTYWIDYSQLDSMRSTSSLPKLVVGLNGKLLIRNMTQSDEGVYLCKRQRAGSFSTYFDFASVQLIPSSDKTLLTDVQVISNDDMLLGRSPASALAYPLNDFVMDMCFYGQRFYIRTLDGKASVVENADRGAVPSPVSSVDKNELRRNAVTKREAFLNGLKRGSPDERLAAAERFVANALNNGSDGNANQLVWSQHDLSVRPNGRYSIDIRGACDSATVEKQLAACRSNAQSANQCGCTLEQSYEIAVFLDTFTVGNLLGLRSADDVPAMVAQPILVRVLSTLYNTSECARLRESFVKFNSRDTRRDDDIKPMEQCNMPESIATVARPVRPVSRPSNHSRSLEETTRSRQVQPDETESESSLDGIWQLLVGAMVLCVAVVLAVLIFVAVRLARMRTRLASIVRRKPPSPSLIDYEPRVPPIYIGDSRRLLYSNALQRTPAELQQLVQFDQTARSSAAVALQIDTHLDADRLAGTDVHCHKTPDDATEHDCSSASASSSGATSNTSCFCSTNVSLNSREVVNSATPPLLPAQNSVQS